MPKLYPPTTRVMVQTWYGDSEGRGKDTWLWVKLAPSEAVPTRKDSFLPRHEWKLVIRGLALPVHGPCVVRTNRYVQVPSSSILRASAPHGPPELAVDVSYDPSGPLGAWQGRAQGAWLVKLVRVRRKTAWQRLR